MCLVRRDRSKTKKQAPGEPPAAAQYKGPILGQGPRTGETRFVGHSCVIGGRDGLKRGAGGIVFRFDERHRTMAMNAASRPKNGLSRVVIMPYAGEELRERPYT